MRVGELLSVIEGCQNVQIEDFEGRVYVKTTEKSCLPFDYDDMEVCFVEPYDDGLRILTF